MSTRARRILGVTAGFVVLFVLWWWWNGSGSDRLGGSGVPHASDEMLWSVVPQGQQPPQLTSNETWDVVLGGDDGGDGAAGALSGVVVGDVPDAGGAMQVATSYTVARLRGEGGYKALESNPFPLTEPDSRLEGHCSTVDPVASSVMALPSAGDVSYAKVLVLYKAECSDALEPSELRVAYAYLADGGAGWEPVRATQIPWSLNVADSGDGMPVPSSLEVLEGCVPDGDDQFELLAEAAAAWEVLCGDATDAGVGLVAVSALRSPEEQSDRVKDAQDMFGDPATAQKWVSSSDADGCASRHCAGAAVDIDDRRAQLWVTETVGCLVGDEMVTVSDDGCTQGVAVPRVAAYGFVVPNRAQPWHLEFVWPTAGEPASSCSPPLSMSIPEMVGSIWRCRLGAAGWSAEAARQIAAEAVEVARCTSGWNPAAVEAGGRWVDEVDPVSGVIRDGAGVFLVNSHDSEAYIPGGRDYVLDARANISGAAGMWLANRAAGGNGWEPWACARDVAPSAGGPALPDAAYLR